MEPPPKRQKQHSHDADGSSRQNEVAQPQSGGHRESNTHDGIGIQSKGNFTVGGDLHINVNNTTTEIEDKIKQKQKEKEEPRKRLLESLRHSQIYAREFGIKKAHASTCQWILKKHQYQLWAQTRQKQGSDRLIWLKGKPGTGKSTMMKFLLGHIQSQLVTSDGNEVLISFFFNARGNDLEKTALGMYRSLLLQLLEKKPEVQTVLDSLEPNHEWTIDSLETILEHTLLCLDGATVTCLVDALDECGISQARDMVELFNRLTQASNRLYVCFASRHYPHISIAASLEIVLEHQPEHRHDIESYVSSKLQIGSGQLADQICSDILAKASGIFIWVVLVVDILNREFDAGRKHTLRKRLGQLPKDLHELFRDILTRDTENVDGLLLCLQWLLFAQRPLTPKELYFAMISGLEPDFLQTCHAEDIYEDDIRKYILDNSKGLAEPIGDFEATVQFIHESIVDFLIKDNGLATIFSDLGNGIRGRSHDSLKFCCLNYLDFVELSGAHQHLHPATIGYFRDFPFKRYAKAEFISHADQAEAGGIEQNDFMASFHLGKWIWPLDKDLEYKDLKDKDIHLPSPLYLLATKGAASLIRAHRGERSCFTLEQSRYAMPIMAAAAAGGADAVLALLEVEVGRTLTLSFQDLRGQVPQVNPEDIEWAKASSYQFGGKEESRLVHLGEFAPELVTIVFLRMFEVDVNALDRHGLSPLFHAISRDHCILMEHLIDLHADVSIRNQKGGMLIHWAVRHGRVRASTILCESRCDINAQDDDGHTPLRLAIQHYRSDALEILLNNKANTECRDEKGRTPLHNAVLLEMSSRAVELLLRGGAYVNARDQEGRTPLHYAMIYLRDAESLLENSADVSAADSEGRTPLRYALLFNSSTPSILSKAIKLLQKYGADVSAADHEGRTSLHWSIGLGLYECVVQLVDCGADISKPDTNGCAPIWWAVWASRPDPRSIELLIDHGANIQDCDEEGYTLLHCAVENGKAEVVEVLVRNQASTETMNKDGQSPLDLAMSLGFMKIVSLLRSPQNR